MKKGKVVPGQLKYKTSKLKPLTVKLSMKLNPEWTKQLSKVKVEIQKLNKLQAFTISEI